MKKNKWLKYELNTIVECVRWSSCFETLEMRIIFPKNINQHNMMTCCSILCGFRKKETNQMLLFKLEIQDANIFFNLKTTDMSESVRLGW